MENPILNVDSYKASHYLQYPPHTSHVSSYIESRGGKFERLIFFGLQMFIKQYLLKPITQTHIDEAAAILPAHGLPFNRAGWEYILKNHRGFLPLELSALPEGSQVAHQVALVQVHNTDPKCAWLTSYVETALLRAVWYPTTVATISNRARQIIGSYLKDTADSQAGLPFKLHDFGARGASSLETAALGGCAHLVNFAGTDTIAGLMAARRFYHADMPAVSIPAAEHSTVTCWGREFEGAAYANMLKQFSGENKIFAVVSDSYDLWNAIDHLWGEELKDAVIHNGGTVVIRPDSGEPVAIVHQTIERLMAKFGSHINAKGYRQLPDFVRVIQGDGIGLESIKAILANLKRHQISAENIAFGMGGALLQQVNRDTLDFAMKASACCVQNQWRDVFKDPVTDSAKRSKKGRLAVVMGKNGFETIRHEDLNGQENQLKAVYRDGELLVDVDFDSVRARVAAADAYISTE